jgi:hypothetical protein
MENWQIIIVVLFGFFGFFGFLFGLKNSWQKKNPYGLTQIYNLIGSFVWADAVIFGLFWTIVTLIILLASYYRLLVDGSGWKLFLLIYSLFWLVRSIGETIYWIFEQFAVEKRNPPHTLWHSKIFPGDSAHVASQIFWQCMTVITILTSVYLIKLLL